MATDIRDLKEMEIQELTRLYGNIYANPSNKYYGHNIPTLDLIRSIIIWKFTGQSYIDYCEIVNSLGEDHFDTTNNKCISFSDAHKVFRNKELYGIGDEITLKDYNIEITEEFKTISFVEEQESIEESDEYIRQDIINEREDYLNDQYDKKIITLEELNELKQIRLVKKRYN
jgi:hypothetical protein